MKVETNEEWEKVIAGMAAAKQHAKSLGLKRGSGGRGQCKCPNCEGEISYSVASVNGHMHARCSTPQCVSFME